MLLSLCTAALCRPNEARVKRLEESVERAQEVDKRGICYDDDTLESFQEYIVDSAPYCSSLLSIKDFTSTISRTSRT